MTALKLMRHEASSVELDRFMREARTLSELRHPGIVSYVAHGISSEGVPYLAMEWLEGEDLGQRLRRQPLTLDEVMILLRNVATALAAAHEATIFHRDIKPSNLFLRDGNVEGVALIDFGLARRAFSGGNLTQTGMVVGTDQDISWLPTEELVRTQPLWTAKRAPQVSARPWLVHV
jgi:serine/threonine protein kinase